MSYRDSIALFSLMQPVHRRPGEGDYAAAYAAPNVLPFRPSHTAPRRAGQAACFGPGTQLATPYGEVDATDLRAGDLVTTVDAGPQPIAWINHINVMGYGHDTPITIDTGTLNNTAPLIVSQAQRLLIDDSAAELLFGGDAVLATARDLLGLPGVSVTPVPRASYTQILLASHQLLIANGTPAESLFLDQRSLGCLDTRVGHALAQMAQCFGESAAPCLTAQETAVWCRHTCAA